MFARDFGMGCMEASGGSGEPSGDHTGGFDPLTETLITR
jgi:hypothetical protein